METLDKGQTIPLLGDILQSLPEEYLQIRTRKSIQRLAVTLSIAVLIYFLLAILPWFFLPLGWFFMGAVFSGLNSVGYACKFNSFSRYPIINSIVGNLVTTPLLFPFEAWRSFNRESWPAPTSFWWLSSVKEWWSSNTHIRSAFQTGRSIWLIASVSYFYVTAVLSLSALVYFFGVWGLCNFWLFPWLVYHCWMSTFITLSYNTAKTEDSGATIVFHCKYPHWVEYLTNDMNYMMTASHYLSTVIPSYNIKRSYNTLRSEWARYFKEVTAGTAMRSIIRQNVSEYKKLGVRVNWIAVIFLVYMHVTAAYGLFNVELKRGTAIVGVVTYFLAGLGITAGYHRLFAHRAYEASWITKVSLMIMGTAAFEGSILWWSRDHRAHHRFSDTEKDPYGVDKGLFWAHMGWLFFRKDKQTIGKTDISDLTSDPMIAWQHKHYGWFSLLVGIVIPTLFCGIVFGDYWGGYFWASIIRSLAVMQATWCINSLAHYLGEDTYSDQRSPRDSWIVSLITFGEGYHCFHHEFPYDYRNGVRFYCYDPTKWLIYGLSLLGLTHNLKRFPQNEIDKGAYLMQLKKLNAKKEKIKWGPEPSTLPVFSMEQVREDTAKGASLIVVNGIVHDVSKFIGEHPGGPAFIKSYMGKDATKAFTGGVYAHSLAANNVLEFLRVGRIES